MAASLEWFAKTRETKCNNQGVIKCNNDENTKENLKKLRTIKRINKV